MNEVIEKIFENVNPILLKETGYTKYEILLMIVMGHTVPIVDKLNSELGTEIQSNNDLFKHSLKIFPEKANIIRSMFSETGKKTLLNESIKQLAVDLMNLFPKGTKSNSRLYWKSNVKEVSERLIKFFTEYGHQPYEDILKSAETYVNSFDYQDMRYMQVLKYFIIKKKDSGWESTLYNMLINNNEGYTFSEDVYSDKYGMMLYAGKSN